MKSNVAVTARGPVEFLLEGDSGPLVVGLHGAPGSCFQMSLLLDRLELTGKCCRQLTVSRPGYGRTPLSSGRSVGAQCELLAALLDSLGLSGPVILTAFSAGGIIALEFARRYPERTAKLLLISPVTGKLAMFGSTPLERFFNRVLFSGFFMYLVIHMTGHCPRLVLRFLLKAMTRIRGDALVDELDRLEECPEDREFLLDVLRRGLPFRHMKPGIRNDDRNTLAADVTIYHDLKQPILLFHGDRDADVPIRHSRQLCELLPSTTHFIRIKGGGHLLLVHPQLSELRSLALRWLREF